MNREKEPTPFDLSSWAQLRPSGQPIDQNLASSVLGQLGDAESLPRNVILALLNNTARPSFLKALSEEQHIRWVEISFRLLRSADLSFDDLFRLRVEEHPERTLLATHPDDGNARWSYQQVYRQIRRIAASFLRTNATPCVAIFAANHPDTAMADLACLAYDIRVTPLNIHMQPEELRWILERLHFDVLVTDSAERLRTLQKAAKTLETQPTFLLTQPVASSTTTNVDLLPERLSDLNNEEVETLLENRVRLDIDDVCTVLFTSGSTGAPKGVAFSRFNLLSKRFARAAALPDVGEEERLFAFLPLYHTFGRFLELLGMLFWHGTYIFAGNPGFPRLLSGFKHFRPTGMISVPVRWSQIHEQVNRTLLETDKNNESTVLRSLVGPDLHWGLSAAGYLDPQTFHFFQNHNVELASGFGMTEATGGITMSPPGDYVENSVGKSLPGIDVLLRENRELWISGAYVARYLDPEGTGFETLPEIEHDGKKWVATGDLFEELANGHLQIVDRVKDIYKNNRGQTVAPKRVEDKFERTPGFRRTFLVGDHRAHNVLLIVPDEGDPVFQGLTTPERTAAYFRTIIANANKTLPPYERVQNYALLSRDFSAELGELTAKNSYRRKIIEKNFATTIGRLYQSKHIVLRHGKRKIQIPRWVYSDLGILETDLELKDGHLFNAQTNARVTLRWINDETCQIGEFIYPVQEGTLALETFLRSPLFWLGNSELVASLPCKEGWSSQDNFTLNRPILPVQEARGSHPGPAINSVSEPLQHAHKLIHRFTSPDPATIHETLDETDTILAKNFPALRDALLFRTTGLAEHPDENVRAHAYRTLLMQTPLFYRPTTFMPFIRSGKRFLNQRSIELLASSTITPRRLTLLRQRLLYYRNKLPWPVDRVTEERLLDILKLLQRFADIHPEFYRPVRAELASWIVFRRSSYLTAKVEKLLNDLVERFETALDTRSQHPYRQLCDYVCYDSSIDAGTRERLCHILLDSTFLKQTIMLAFDTPAFDMNRIGPNGIWISPLASHPQAELFRLSVNTIDERHYPILLILRRDSSSETVWETIYHFLTLYGYPSDKPLLPRFGCFRPELSAFSLEFIDEPTAWEMIRRYAQDKTTFNKRAWKTLYIRAISTILNVWEQSGRAILPGQISPTNVAIPLHDYHDHALLLSLSGWRPAQSVKQIFAEIFAAFYQRVEAHFPAVRRALPYRWLFDATIEASGREKGLQTLIELHNELEDNPQIFPQAFHRQLAQFIEEFDRIVHVPLSVEFAVERYLRWCSLNPDVTDTARGEMVESLIRLYHLERLTLYFRYFLYRETYFRNATEEVRNAFDHLLDALHQHRDTTPLHRPELADLQQLLEIKSDKQTFVRMILPSAEPTLDAAISVERLRTTSVVMLKTQLEDKRGNCFNVRPPAGADEIGKLFRLYHRERVAIAFRETHEYLVLIDKTGQLTGGLSYWIDEGQTAFIEGIVIRKPYTNKGLGSALLADFISRMRGEGINVIRSGFLMNSFVAKHGFTIDKNWAGLILKLTPEA